MKKSKKWSLAKTWYVPEELWPEILSRLPLKSLLRFRCVSTSWRAMIDDPGFAHLHLTRFNNNLIESHLLFAQASTRTTECVVRCSKTLRAKARLGFLETDLPSSSTLRATPAQSEHAALQWDVCCSVDGLFMLHHLFLDHYPKLMLWNPSIRKTRMLSLPLEINNDVDYLDFGLGFDPLIKDYKFVRFAYGRGIVYVYTLGTNSWKTMSPHDGLQDEEGSSSSWHRDVSALGGRALCWRGALYALVGNGGSGLTKLVSFDLGLETFASTRLPVDPSESGMYSQVLTTVDGGSSLALVSLRENQAVIWALGSSGDEDFASLSWTRRYSAYSLIVVMQERSFTCDWGTSARFVYLTKKGVMLLAVPLSNCHGMLTSYNLETNKESILLKKIPMEGNSFFLVKMEGNSWPYMESLIQL